MLFLTSAQLDAIASGTLLNSVERHWRAVFAASCDRYPQEALRQLARDCIEAARLDGLRSRDEVILYCDLCWVARVPAWPGLGVQDRIA